ncbi:hypothetical protein HOK31_22425, partial [Candidatus Poribacteria bacterium]|nr:hypothetical protein [Candidatus Poribacteria bacterium]
MSRFVGTTVLCLLFAAGSAAQDVAICYDGGLPTLGLNDGPGFAQLLVDELGSHGVSAEIVDAPGLAEYMNANPEGIMLVC